MSLIAHFPLNGNLNNRLEGLLATYSTTASYESSRFGPSLKFSSSQLYINNPFIGMQEFSLSLWFRPNESGDWTDVITFSGDKQRLEMYNSGTALNFYSDTTKYGQLFTSGSWIGNTSKTGWSHFVITFNHGTAKAYLNDVCVLTNTSAKTFKPGADKIYFGSRIDGMYSNIGLFDVRLYDSALSTAEIHELSKGLICHYSFDNWAPRNEFVTLVGNACGSYGSLSMDDPITFRITATNNSTATTHGLWWYWTRSDTGLLAPSTSYVFSFEAFNASQTANIVVLSEAGSISGSNYQDGGRVTCTVKNRWVKIYGILTTSSTQSGGAIMFYPNPYAGHFRDGYQLFRNIKLYKGTEYIEDAVCSDKVNDNSGIGNHSVNYNVTAVSGAAKGDTCAKLVGSNYVTCPTTMKIPGPMSYNIWAYMDNWSTFATSDMRILSCTESGGFNIEPSGSNIQFAVFDSKAGSSGTGDYVVLGTGKTAASLSAGWHMFAFTFDGSTARCYIDGVNLKTSSMAGEIGYNSTNTIFLGAEASTSGTAPHACYFTGKLDDFKMWGSRLSDADILDEYKSRAIISSNYNLSTSKVKENCNVSTIKSTGSMETQEVVENKYFITEDGTKFLRIFDHNLNADPEMFGHANEASFSVCKNRDSRLNDISLFKDPSNKYEFLLRYPNLSTLPPDFQEVEYIQSTGTQYIKSGVIGTPAAWQFDIKFNDLTTRQIMGYAGSSGQYWEVTSSGYYGVYSAGPIPAGNVDRVLFDYPNGLLLINGVVSNSVGGDITNCEFQVLALGGGSCCKCNLYRCRAVTPNNVVLREFVPCYRKADGQIGLYDLITRSFFGNAGTGVFQKGSNVYKKEHYIYNRWNQSVNPMTTAPSSSHTASSTGYTPIEICWSTNWQNGMVKSSSPSEALLDCQAGHGNWYGSIGQYRSWASGGVTGFPSPNGTAQTHVELYVKVSDESMCNYVRNNAIPKEYQEVDYIQSTGTQLIDIGLKVNNDSDKYELGFTPNDGQGNYFIAGSGWQENGKVWVYHYPSGNAFNLYITNTSGTQVQLTGTPGTPAQRYDIIYDAKKLYVNGVLTGDITTHSLGSTPFNFTLFNSNQSTGYSAKTKIHYFKLYQNNVCVRDMVPCYRKSDNVIGMYDKASKTFFVNSGSGTFSKGSNINRSVVYMNEIREV